MSVFIEFKQQIVHGEKPFKEFKAMLALIINYSVKDALYCLS